ncbi:FAD-dependent oxidoreductase [Herbiconiux sp. A18JL235]|uniref:FAD-dependent oxidoreductase n=1 Tax=Herbiconiux sp. A18JL235 TaxID=3152363 RepID=A0AB39BBZ1_9MICO
MTLTVPPRATSSRLDGLPVAVIGAGPVGLAAAAHLLERGLDVVVFEAGERAGSAVAAWGHVRLFSPWTYLLDPAAVRLLAATGWTAPAGDRSPTGSEFLDSYLGPLARTSTLEPLIRLGCRVTAVSRQGMDRTRSTGRGDTPFLLRVDGDGTPTDVLARAVIDTSGTFHSPNPLTASGLEPSITTKRIVTGLPDVLGSDRPRFAGRRVLVVGAGHSAANALLALGELARAEPGTRVTWAVRNPTAARVFTAADDRLPDRASIGRRLDGLVSSGAVALVDRFEIDAVEEHVERTGEPSTGFIRATGRRAGAPFAIEADVIVNATGFRPDLDLLREIRLGLDDIVEAPRALASLIDPNLHSCGTVPPHGVAELTHPEPDFFIAGMKSYGRAPTFLLATGYEQVRSIADELAGHHDAARVVHLSLPATGVCSTAPADDATTDSTRSDAGCCTTSSPVPTTAASCCR